MIHDLNQPSRIPEQITNHESRIKNPLAAALVCSLPFLQLLPLRREILRASRDLALGLVEGPLLVRPRALERVQHAVIVLVAGILEDPILLALAAPGVMSEVDNSGPRPDVHAGIVDRVAILHRVAFAREA